MKKKKLEKGMYGFHLQKKKFEIIKTLILFGIALAVYFVGLFHTKTNKNLLSVVAIIGMLPASKSAVSMLMFVRFPSAAASIPKHLNSQIQTAKEHGILLYDLIFVLVEKVIKTECIFIKDTKVMVYTTNTKLSENVIALELNKFLKNHGKGNSSVVVCTTEESFQKYVNRHIKDETSEKSFENQNKIRDMLLGYSM